ncbi:MAG: DUF4292 domain-containing protein [Polaribacter sp.]|nr:DUF4292 domain-containing protein [Polaribacter sp.]
MSPAKVSKKHIATLLDKQTLEAKLKVAYTTSKHKKKISVKLRIEKDTIIWLNATYAGLLVARAKITPTKMSYYEKVSKTHFEGDFTIMRKFLGAEVSFSQLQNLLLGQAIFDLKQQKYEFIINENAYLLLPKKQDELFNVFFWINPTHFKLDKQELISRKKNQLLQVQYKNYALIDEERFPKRIEIQAKENRNSTRVIIEYRNIIFNKKFSTPYRVPRGYKRIVLK